MSLPSNFANSQEYFNAAIEFLKEFDWIYKYSNTTFIKAGVLESFPRDFKAYFLAATNEELNKFPFLNFQTNIENETSKIHKFRVRLKNLIPAQAFDEASFKNSAFSSKTKTDSKFKKMNLKKQHEIIRLANLIHELCKDDVDLLIDFGAGLGYLSETLYTISNNKFLILGLEAEAERVKAATKRQKEFMPEACDNILYEQQFINESSGDFIKSAATSLAENNKKSKMKAAIIGLHACADLSITAIKIFFEIGKDLKRLIIMPCCYHKLEMDERTLKFRNFPLSQTLQNALEPYKNFENFLNRPFLRLACQQTLARWENTNADEHRKHGLDMFRRGLAEAIIEETNEYVVKRKRTVKDLDFDDNKETFSRFSEFYELRTKTSHEILPWSTTHELRFNEFQEKFEAKGDKLAGGLTCLQTAMQKLCENIVLYDRLCYIEEYASANNVKVNVRYEKLLDEKLSPRCYVLIAEKL